jgi:hypothetical protein
VHRVHRSDGKFDNQARARRAGVWTARALVVLSVLLVHGASITFGFVGLDDRDLVLEDHAFLARRVNLLRIFTRAYMHVVDGQHVYFRPLVTASYVLDAQWSGVEPFGYHVTNIVLHAIASVLLLSLLRGFALGPAADLGALVFAVHPALAADVAWIPGRNDSLLAVFVLAAWLLLPTDSRRPSWGRWLGHWALFGLSLLTKETAIAAPLVWMLHLALFGRFERAALPKRYGARTALVASWGMAVAGWLVLRPLGIGTASRGVAHAVAANLPLAAASVGELVFPVNPSLLSVSKDMPVGSGILALGLGAAAAALVPGVRMRVVALGAAAFVLYLAPTLVAGTTLVLSSRLYLPACGAILAAAEIVRALGLHFEGRSTVCPPASLSVAFSGLIVVALAFIAVAYESTFKDQRAFAKAAVEASPHSGLAHLCLGWAYQTDGDGDRALAEYRLALALGSVEVAHNNIAVIYMAGGDWNDAEGELRSELAVNPRYGRAYRNLAVVLRRRGRPEEARVAEERANAVEGEPRGP